jgi:hypothetical protein
VSPQIAVLNRMTHNFMSEIFHWGHTQPEIQKHSLNVIHGHAFINNSYDKSKQCTNDQITFLNKICHDSDMFQVILIIFRELLNINKAYIKTWMDY